MGPYLRIVSINDVYTIENYPPLKTVIESLKATSDNAVVKAVLNGDFLSPCLITALDGGRAMMNVLDVVGIDYLCFGNHEFDLDLDTLRDRFKTLSGKCLNSNIEDLPVVDASGQPLPTHDIIQVGDRRIVFTGFCTDNTDLLKPEVNLTIRPIFDALKEIWSKCDDDADVVIPLTHQPMEGDRELAARIGQDEQLQNSVPVILGGHEHDVYIDEADQRLIVKSGSDATNAVVVDIWWNDDAQPQAAVHLLPTHQFDADAEAQGFVDKTHKFLGSLLDVEIFEVKEKMSSKKPRYRPEKVASTLCSHIKSSLKSVDLVLLQGGSIRGGKDYDKGDSFTYGDLLEEIPFETQMAIIQIPGHILQEAISQTRSTPNQETSSFLHADLNVEIEPHPSLKITHINREPFDPQNQYRLGIYQYLLTGLDDIEPLVTYANSIDVPPLEQCLPAKNLVLESCMKDAWKALVDFKVEADVDRQMPREDLEQAVKKAFAALDKNEDGYVSPANISAALEKKTGRHQKDLVRLMLETVDTDDDDRASMDELASLVI